MAEVHYEPFGIYAGRVSSLSELPDGAVIGIPNDPTNGGRALLLLQEQGLITLPEDAGLEPTVLDIVDNPHNYQIEELEAAQLPVPWTAWTLPSLTATTPLTPVWTWPMPWPSSPPRAPQAPLM